MAVTRPGDFGRCLFRNRTRFPIWRRRALLVISTLLEVKPMIPQLIHRLESMLADGESGQTMAEYAVVLAVITIAVVAVIAALSTAIQGQLNAVIGAL
jgi:Flp pilus assembly pilin Flp